MRKLVTLLTSCWLIWVSLPTLISCRSDEGQGSQAILDQDEAPNHPPELAPNENAEYFSDTSARKLTVKTPLELHGKIDIRKLNRTLLALTLQPLPLGSVKPKGWFQEQLKLMADGLPGRMHEFYRLVRDATWLGGSEEYSALNEAWPYYINGLIPLAYGLDDYRLKQHVRREVDRVLQLQHEDGWLGPETNVSERNFWARYPLFLGLTQLAEVVEFKERKTILTAMHKFVDLMHDMLTNEYQGYVRKKGDNFNEQWGRSRAADMILALQWLYEASPGDNADSILECMAMLYEMSYDWAYWFREDVFMKEDVETLHPNITDRMFPYLHGVNAAQGLKFGAVIRRLNHNNELLDSTRRGVEWTFTYHGTPSGAIIADERLSGLSPVRGTELCSVVETMYSLSYLYHALGDRSFADRVELTAFNAYTTMVMPRWWAHQYVAQTNQPYSHELSDPPFWNVGSDGQTFGLEPHYPCCTVQFSQGFPKLLSASWARTGNNGIAHTILIPSEVKTDLRTLNKHQKQRKNKIHITCKTNYPFAFFLTYTVNADYDFNFSFRVPSWTDTNSSSSFIYITTRADPNPEPVSLEPNSHTGLHNISLPRGHSIVEVSLFPKRIEIQSRPNNTISVTHGPLLYGHSPHHYSVPHRPSSYPGDMAPPQSNDWTITPRKGDIWNYAIDPNTLRFYSYDNRYDEHLPNPIWRDDAPPVSISVLACEVDWKLSPVNKTDKNVRGGGYAEPPPLPGKRNCTGRAVPIELQPYGSASIRIAEFPIVDLSPGSPDLWDPFGSSRSKGDYRERTEL